eukprot:gene12560-3255_t
MQNVQDCNYKTCLIWKAFIRGPMISLQEVICTLSGAVSDFDQAYGWIRPGLRWSDARKRYFGIYSPVMDRKKTSEQHVQLGPSRVPPDNKDLTLIKEWFDLHNPFGEDGQHLKSLSTGLIADDRVNCDEAENVGRNIQNQLDNRNMEDASIK